MAGNQGHEAQVMEPQEKLRQEILFNEFCLSLVILENESRAAPPFFAVAEEMKEVKTVRQPRAQPLGCDRRFEKHYIHRLGQRRESGFETTHHVFTVDLRHAEAIEIGRRRDDAQQAGPCAGRRPLLLPHLQIAGERGVRRTGKGQMTIGVDQQLPAQGMDPFRETRSEVQPEAQAALLPFGGEGRLAQPLPQIATVGKNRFIELTAIGLVLVPELQLEEPPGHVLSQRRPSPVISTRPGEPGRIEIRQLEHAVEIGHRRHFTCLPSRLPQDAPPDRRARRRTVRRWLRSTSRKWP